MANFKQDIRTSTTRGLSGLEWAAVALVFIGTLNWALVGLFRFDLVAAIFGQLSWVSRVLYVLVGIAGLYLISVATRFRREIGAV
jgi:uncharacterized membrane protein YuzA (DUF378 family)